MTDKTISELVATAAEAHIQHVLANDALRFVSFKVDAWAAREILSEYGQTLCDSAFKMLATEKAASHPDYLAAYARVQETGQIVQRATSACDTRTLELEETVAGGWATLNPGKYTPSLPA